MKITRSADLFDEPVDDTHFDGAVTRRDYGAVDDPAGTALLVSFPAGARTHWHSHPNGQVLYVTDGAGRVGTRGGASTEIGPGDLVVAAPGEEHWHGASEHAAMRHLAVSFGDTVWLEPVEE